MPKNIQIIRMRDEIIGEEENIWMSGSKKNYFSAFEVVSSAVPRREKTMQ